MLRIYWLYLAIFYTGHQARNCNAQKDLFIFQIRSLAGSSRAEYIVGKPETMAMGKANCSDEKSSNGCIQKGLFLVKYDYCKLCEKIIPSGKFVVPSLGGRQRRGTGFWRPHGDSV